MTYIAKPDTWFDVGTEATLIGETWQNDDGGCGLFCGARGGSPDEEVCQLDEFEVVENNP